MRILILVGGGVKHLEPFKEAGEKCGVSVVTASFSQINYTLDGGKTEVRCGTQELSDFQVIYFRLVGKRAEDAALVAQYAKGNGIKVVDQVFHRGYSYLPLKKSLEMALLVENGIPLPKTYFGTLKQIKEKAEEIVGFPMVVKGSYGKQGHAVWLVKNTAELAELNAELAEKEKEGKRFFAQEFIKIKERTRVFVVGDKIIGYITLPTKWRKYVAKTFGDTPVRPGLAESDLQIAVKASKALGIEVAGVDLIRDNETGKVYVLEVNSAPRWARIKRETGINVEEEIVKYLSVLSLRGTK